MEEQNYEVAEWTMQYAKEFILKSLQSMEKGFFTPFSYLSHYRQILKQKIKGRLEMRKDDLNEFYVRMHFLLSNKRSEVDLKEENF